MYPYMLTSPDVNVRVSYLVGIKQDIVKIIDINKILVDNVN